MSDESDSDDDGWINQDNIAQKLQNSSEMKPTEMQLGVAVMTSDFPMQNILLQLGIPCLGVDGLCIRSLRKFVYWCYACNTYQRGNNVYKTQRHQLKQQQFCAKCANPTLNKITCQIDDKGQVRVFRKKNYKFNNRGKIYPIPKPKGGRKNDNLVLREDELMTGNKQLLLRNMEKQQEKQFQNAFNSFDNGFGFDVKKQQNQFTGKFGYGRKNPNEKKKKR